MNNKTYILVSIRWNKIQSHTEKNKIKYPLSVITVFQIYQQQTEGQENCRQRYM